MGCAVTSFVRGRGGLFEQVALSMTAGMLINFCLMLTGLTMTRVFIAGIVLASYGVWRIGADLRIGSTHKTGPSMTTVFSVCCIAYILAVYYLKVFSEPLEHWDARSIWFLHAKMIWIKGALTRSAGWSHPSLAFSHPDYPKLVPAIAAQLGYVKGYWNDFFPKGSLVVMLVPLTLWVFSFCQKRLSFILLVLMFFFSLDGWLSNGYMDGYLALYCGMALLLFGRYLSERRDTDLYSGMCALGIAANLKNEGLLFGLCLSMALLLISAARIEFGLRPLAKRIRSDFLFA